MRPVSPPNPSCNGSLYPQGLNPFGLFSTPWTCRSHSCLRTLAPAVALLALTSQASSFHHPGVRWMSHPWRCFPLSIISSCRCPPSTCFVPLLSFTVCPAPVIIYTYLIHLFCILVGCLSPGAGNMIISQRCWKKHWDCRCLLLHFPAPRIVPSNKVFFGPRMRM